MTGHDLGIAEPGRPQDQPLGADRFKFHRRRRWLAHVLDDLERLRRGVVVHRVGLAPPGTLSIVRPHQERLTLYGRPSQVPPLAWTWVDAELAGAGTYWVVPRGGEHPHPRPVWGVWQHEELHLSIGSPVIGRLLGLEGSVTVHLDSAIDVVIVEGSVAGFADAPDLYGAYNAKYDWNYTVEEYGPLTTIVPTAVLAWRSAGRAGCEGIQQTGRWRFGPAAGAP